MGRLKTLWSIGVILGLSAPAVAADFSPPPPPPAGPIVSELGSGWYLRGDVGYVRYRSAKDADASPSNPILRDIKFGDTYSFGGGFGYQFTNWLRADVTADYRAPAKFSNWSSGSFDRGGAQGIRGFNVEKGEFETTILLANAYVDLGNWYGMTPYLGAGIGTAQRGFRDFYTQTTCLVDGCLPGAPAGPLARVDRRHRSTWGLVYALMGGVSTSLGHGFILDLGYRYLRLGDAESGFDIGIVGPARTRLKDLDSHEIRLGVRYMID